MIIFVIRAISFENAKEWKREIENNADREVLVYLVGNFADLGESLQREVKTEEAIKMMNDLGLNHHLETSALTGQNINELFETLTKHLYLDNGVQTDDPNAAMNNNRKPTLTNDDVIERNSKIDLYQPRHSVKKKGCAC